MEIFNASIFNNAVFNTGAAAPTASVGPAPGAGRSSRRRRYIMPDGTMLEATTDEVFAWLRLYSAPKPQPTPAPRAATIRAPAIVLEKRNVRFVPATDSSPDTWMATISERFSFRAPPEMHRQAEILANRMRADEEALVSLLM